MRDVFEKGVVVVDGDVSDTVGPEEETDVSSKLSVGPVCSVGPRHIDLGDGFVDELNSLRGKVKRDAAPVQRSCDEVLDTELVDFPRFVNRDVSLLAAFNEDLGVVEDIILGTDEDNVIDVGVRLAPTAFEV